MLSRTNEDAAVPAARAHSCAPPVAPSRRPTTRPATTTALGRRIQRKNREMHPCGRELTSNTVWTDRIRADAHVSSIERVRTWHGIPDLEFYIGPRKGTDAVDTPRREQSLETTDEVLASTGWADKARAACAICDLIGKGQGRANAARVVSLIEAVAGSAGAEGRKDDRRREVCSAAPRVEGMGVRAASAREPRASSMVVGWRSAIGAGWRGETGATRGETPVMRRGSARCAVVVSYLHAHPGAFFPKVDAAAFPLRLKQILLQDGGKLGSWSHFRFPRLPPGAKQAHWPHG